jgi:catabolite repression protein CreC
MRSKSFGSYKLHLLLLQPQPAASHHLRLTWHVTNASTYRLLALFPAYYGGFLCVCWSPDGKYVLTGGQDDLITIWCPSESAIIARCQGHGSWVTSVAFDPWRCDERNYRFGSVGEDCRLCLWDFNVGMLHKPKAAASTSVRNHRGGSISSRLTVATKEGRLRSNSAVSGAGAGEDGDGEDREGDGLLRTHTVEPRSRIPILPPVLMKKADKDPLSWLEFTEDAILTSCKSGESLHFCVAKLVDGPCKWIARIHVSPA